ncbi:hypothetical protein BD779DRAFT_1790265 [Infundibulicybe gibba]|nr:hypothetical protein BD779DRAFT_1790265 [Infundibulicybe gibba]
MGPSSMVILSTVLGFIIAAAADVTLYNVVGPTPIIEYISATYSAVGVDAGGSTTYVGTGVETLALQPQGTTTKTLLSTPTTFTDTIIVDKSGYHLSDPGLPPLSCMFLAGGKGSCVGVVVPLNSEILSWSGFTASDVLPPTSTYTETGSLVPWTTIRDPGPTAALNGAGGLYFPSTWVMICLSTMYFLL